MCRHRESFKHNKGGLFGPPIDNPVSCALK
nr:MAG TPA: hypothetical protein [Caudoviricetes sp.]